MPTATRRASRATACRSSPTACRISPDPSPVFSPGSTGPQRTRRRSNGWSACRATVRFCRGFVARLHEARIAAGSPLARARSGHWRHPVVAFWRVDLRENLRHAWSSNICTRSRSGPPRHGVAIADWPDEPIDPFFNVNTPEDVARAQKLAAQYPDA